jgi:hypothetical protein
MVRLPLRLRIANALAGTRLKELIPALKPDGGVWYGSAASGTNDYTSKVDQLSANVGWCSTDQLRLGPHVGSNAASRSSATGSWVFWRVR